LTDGKSERVQRDMSHRQTDENSSRVHLAPAGIKVRPGGARALVGGSTDGWAHDHVTNSSRCIKHPISCRNPPPAASTVPSFNRASF